jgi:ArsR family transcriptional regulator
MSTQVLDDKLLEKVAFILKTIAHPMRIGIIDLLSKHERLSVTEICDKLDLEQSLTSHHLLNMKVKGILASERDGKHIFYSIKLQEVKKIINCIENCEIRPF